MSNQENHMTDEQRQEIMRRQAEGMCAMSNEEIAQRQLEAAEGMRQRGPLTSGSATPKINRHQRG